ncbi:hypothetical protein AGMMS50229_18240 [Campylobacterota bacterium]|nr:hypothetical protein AGMMS50229_18240 [Campylobacterota bacterium]
MLPTDTNLENDYIIACKYIYTAAIGYTSPFCDFRPAFTKILDASHIQSVVAGYFSIFAIDDYGTIWARGNNVNGQLGVGDTDFRFNFEKVLPPAVVGSMCAEYQYYDYVSEKCEKAPSASIYFVNGVFNTEQGAFESARAIEIEYNFDLYEQYSTEQFNFELSYNYHYGYVNDLKELFWQKLKELQYDDELITYYFVSWMTDIVINVNLVTALIKESIDMYTMTNEEITATELDNLNTMNLQYIGDLQDGKRLILVAHSQGNMYANQSVSKLRADFPNVDHYIKMIGVVSPAATTNDPYITACDDSVINILRLSPYYSVLNCNINNEPSGEDFRDDMKHEFIRSYFDSRLLSRGLINFELNNILNQWEHPIITPQRINHVTSSSTTIGAFGAYRDRLWR